MRNKIFPFYFVVGALILYLVFVLLPSFMGFFYSFTDWSSYSSKLQFVGLANFKLIFSSSQGYLHYIWNTLTFTVVSIIVKTLISLGLAVLLAQGIKHLASLYRMVIYLPAVLPMLAVSLIFKSILNPATGLLNTFLRNIGLGVLAQQWLVTRAWAMPSVIGVDTWKGVGYLMVILIAGIQAIPTEYFEAAAIDGASSWAIFRYITLPMLRPVLAVTTVLNLLYGLKVFDIIFVLTNGGPGRATDTVYTVIFDEFSKGRWGVATALTSLLFIVMVGLGYFVIRLMTREDGA